MAACRLNSDKLAALSEERRPEGLDAVIFDFEVGDFIEAFSIEEIAQSL